MSVANSFDVSPRANKWFLIRLTRGVSPICGCIARPPLTSAASGVRPPESNPLFGLWETCFPGTRRRRSHLYRRPLRGQRKKVTLNPVSPFRDDSADGKWVVAEAPLREDVTRGLWPTTLTMERRNAYVTACVLSGGRRWEIFAYRTTQGSVPSDNYKPLRYKTFVVPLRHGDSFSDLPATGIKSESDFGHLSGVKVVNDLARPGLTLLFTRSTADTAPKCLPGSNR